MAAKKKPAKAKASKPLKKKTVTAKKPKKAAKPLVRKAKPAPKRKAAKASKAAKPAKAAKPVKSAGKRKSAPPPPPPPKVRSKEYLNTIKSYESALKLMHAEEYSKAIRVFNELIASSVEEPEIQERARMLVQASEKKLHEKARSVLRSADDHYNVGVADLNRRQLDSAIQHLQHALKLAPKGDHILYAMAAVNALQGNRDQALSYLKQAIHHRPENRFQAARDADFLALIEDPDFKQLVTPAEK